MERGPRLSSLPCSPSTLHLIKGLSRPADGRTLAHAAGRVDFVAVVRRVQYVIANISPHDSVERCTAPDVEVGGQPGAAGRPAGAGRRRGGGDGIRRVRFLEPMTASILFNGRRVPAFGLAGYAVGALGINRVDVPTPASRRSAT